LGEGTSQYESSHDHVCPLAYCYRFSDRGFSEDHRAVDLNSPIGRDVFSSCYGQVIFLE